MEVFRINDLALALFDCINSEGKENKIVVDNELEYRKVMDDLMIAHEEAPLSGLRSFFYEKRMITFDSGSVLYFEYKDGEDGAELAQSPANDKPAESLDEFLGKFNVKS